MRNGGGEDRIGLRAGVGLGALVVATFLAIVTEVVPIGLLPQIERDYTVSASTAGLLVTVYAALVAVLAVPLTLVTGRLPRKPLLLATLLGYGLANLVIAAAPSFGVVAAGRAVGGIAHAVFFSVSTAYAAALVPPRLQGRAIAIGLTGASAGYLLGVPLVTRLGAALGERAAFGLLAAAAAVALVAVALALPPVPAPAGARPEGRRGPPRGLVVVATANVLAFLAHYGLYTYVSTLLLARGLPEPALPAALLSLGVAGLAGLLVAGAVVDRRPRAGLLIALGVAAVCVAVIALPGVGTAGTVVAATAWSGAFAAMPTFLATATLRTRVLSPDLSGAVNNAVSNVGIGGGAAAGGGVVALAGSEGAVVLALVLFLAAVAVVLAGRVGFPPGGPG